MLAARKGLKVQTLTPEDTEASAISEAFEPVDGHQATPMESSAPSVPFPLLASPATYDPLSFPLRKPHDDPKELTTLERQWIAVFKKSIPSFRDRAAADPTVEDAPKKADLFAERYLGMLEDFEKDPESHGGPPDILLMCRLRDVVLREIGFHDVFKRVKDEENAKALKILPSLLQRVDAIADPKERVEFLIKGMLAGNVFDLGASNTIDLFEKGELSFEKSFQQLLPRPWVVDNVDQFVDAWTDKQWRKTVFFCDNAGADTILGVLPMARELCKTGAQVVLAGNEMPTINDMTYQDLLSVIQQIQVSIEDDLLSTSLDRGSLLIVSSGNDLPVIDLASTSPELAFASDGAELVVLVGMGRSIETNLNTQFTCDSLNIGMVKHQEVADFLGGRLYDGVVKYQSVDMPPTPSRRVKQPIPLNE